MTELSVTEFRAQCLSLLEDIPPGGIVITKRGKPLARVMPIKQPRRKGKMVRLPLIEGTGLPGPALGDGLTTPYDLIFDDPVFG